jgi:hypothetical protein
MLGLNGNYFNFSLFCSCAQADIKLSFSEGASPASDSASLYAKKKEIEVGLAAAAFTLEPW